jgi:hypothetical protein
MSFPNIIHLHIELYLCYQCGCSSEEYALPLENQAWDVCSLPTPITLEKWLGLSSKVLSQHESTGSYWKWTVFSWVVSTLPLLPLDIGQQSFHHWHTSYMRVLSLNFLVFQFLWLQNEVEVANGNKKKWGCWAYWANNTCKWPLSGIFLILSREEKTYSNLWIWH